MLFGSASVSARYAISELILPFSMRNIYILFCLFCVSIDTLRAVIFSFAIVEARVSRDPICLCGA
jgi:hypothetical protein